MATETCPFCPKQSAPRLVFVYWKLEVCLVINFAPHQYCAACVQPYGSLHLADGPKTNIQCFKDNKSPNLALSAMTIWNAMLGLAEMPPSRLRKAQLTEW